MKKQRYYLLDILRGATLISMIFYHATWDLVYMFHVNLPWYEASLGHLWQQSIFLTFISLSGFCFAISKKNYKRGLIVFGASLLITAVTFVFMPENRIVFGVLSLLGTSMLLSVPLDKILKKINPYIGFIVMLALLFVTYKINDGYLGFGNVIITKLPKAWYANNITAFFGFPTKEFFSADYFPLLPWIFLFWSGYFLQGIFERLGFMKALSAFRIKPLEWLGRHSLVIYLLHQPLIYGILTLFFL